MKSAQAAANNEDVSFALKEHETGIVLEGVIKRAKENVFTHIRQSTDIVLVTSNNRDGKSAFLTELSKEIDSEIRSLSLHSNDLLGASGNEDSNNEVDFSLISAIIYESIQLDEYLLISIDDADKLPLENFNELVTLALTTNTKKNNIIFLFAGGPDLLGQVEQISNIKRLSIAHCTLDEFMYEDLVEFIDLRQNQISTDLQFSFDDQALRTIVTHSSGSLFKAAVLLEWCREYANFNQCREINAATVSKLLSILLNKSQVDGVNLFASYPTPDFDFKSTANVADKKNSPKAKQTRKRSSKAKSKKIEAQRVAIKVVGDKSTDTKPNVYERIMADASEEELIADTVNEPDISEQYTETIATSDTEFISDNNINIEPSASEIEALVLQEADTFVENTTKLPAKELEEHDIEKHSLKETQEESKPLYIENTDLSLTRLVPKQETRSNQLSSLQWTFIILTIGALLFYGGIMLIASNGKQDVMLNVETSIDKDITLDTNNSSEVKDTAPSNEVAYHPVPDNVNIIEKSNSKAATETETSSIAERVKSFFSSLNTRDNTEDSEKAEFELSTEETSETLSASNSADTQKENTIRALLNLAKIQMEDKKLTSPPSDNALDTYQMVLQLDPGNSAASSGIESIRVRYLIWAEQQAVAGNSGQAKFYLERAQEMAEENK